MDKTVYDAIEKEIEKLDKKETQRALREIEVELNEKLKELREGYKKESPEKLQEIKEEIKKIMYKKETLKKRLDEIAPEDIVERERKEFRERAREKVKEVAQGKVQVDPMVLKMLLIHSAGFVPYIEGDTGIGKSEGIRQYAELMDMDYVKVMLTGKEKVHIEGNIIPEVIEKGEDAEVDTKIDTINKYVESGEKTSSHNKRKSLLVHKNTIPEYLNQVLNSLAKGKHVLLHFDEFLRADREVFNTIMDFILENYIEAFQGRFKTGRLHKVATGNPPDIYDGNLLDPAQKQRFFFLKKKANLTEFLKVVAPQKDIHPSILEFLQEHQAKDAFHTAEKHREASGMVGDLGETHIGINPRKWTMISELIKTYEEDYANDPDTKELMLNILEEIVLEDAESYGEKELLKKFMAKYKSDNKLSLNKIKATLRLHYDDIYFVKEGDRESRPLEQMIKAVDSLFRTYEIGKQLDINKKMLLLEDAFNDFMNNFVNEYNIEDKTEKEIKEIVIEAVEKYPEKIFPFLVTLKVTGEAGIKMIEGKFKAQGLKEEWLSVLSAVDDLFNTNFLNDYLMLSLDATSGKNLKNSLNVKDILGLEKIDSLFKDDDFDFDFDFDEEEENTKKKNNVPEK